jgi:hypothetical protein
MEETNAKVDEEDSSSEEGDFNSAENDGFDNDKDYMKLKSIFSKT